MAVVTVTVAVAVSLPIASVFHLTAAAPAPTRTTTRTTATSAPAVLRPLAAIPSRRVSELAAAVAVVAAAVAVAAVAVDVLTRMRVVDAEPRHGQTHGTTGGQQPSTRHRARRRGVGRGGEARSRESDQQCEVTGVTHLTTTTTTTMTTTTRTTRARPTHPDSNQNLRPPPPNLDFPDPRAAIARSLSSGEGSYPASAMHRAMSATILPGKVDSMYVSDMPSL